MEISTSSTFISNETPYIGVRYEETTLILNESIKHTERQGDRHIYMTQHQHLKRNPKTRMRTEILLLRRNTYHSDAETFNLTKNYVVKTKTNKAKLRPLQNHWINRAYQKYRSNETYIFLVIQKYI